MQVSKETKQMFLALFFLLAILAIFVGAGYINMVSSKKSVIVAKQYIPEGTMLNEGNVANYFSNKLVPVSFVEELKLVEYKDDILKTFYNQRIKYSRIKNDWITYDLVKVDKEKDDIKYKVYQLSKEFGKKLVAKSVKLNKDEYFQASGIKKGEDLIKIKFIKDFDKQLMEVERFSLVPILDFYGNGKNITDIVIALDAEVAAYFDLERYSAKKMIVEFEPFASEEFKDNGKKSVWMSEIDEQYKTGVSFKIKKQSAPITEATPTPSEDIGNNSKKILVN